MHPGDVRAGAGDLGRIAPPVPNEEAVILMILAPLVKLLIAREVNNHRQTFPYTSASGDSEDTLAMP